MRELTCAPEVETIGAAMLSLFDNVQADIIRPYLERHHLTEIDPERWYPAQIFFDIMNDLAKNPDVSSNFVAIGLSIVENIVMPPEMADATLEQMLMAWDDLYHMQHRGGEIGSVKTELRGPKHVVTIHDHLYPDDFTYGIAYGWARRLLPPGTPFVVQYDENESRRDEGGERTIIHVSWE